VRLFTVIVLLLLFFFSGMTYGLFESVKSEENNVVENVVDEQTVEEEIENLETVAKLPETEQSFIHSFAQLLERMITFFYELLIQFLYYIASLFF